MSAAFTPSVSTLRYHWTMTTCSVDDCEAGHYGHGYCTKHYSRWKRHGSPRLGAKTVSRFDPGLLTTSSGLRAVDLHVRPGYEKLRDVILSRCEQGNEGCWTWRGALDPRGYGRMNPPRGLPGRVSGLVHRALYTALIESPDPKLHLDHLCRNRACCNPGHLDLVEPRVNLTRGLGPIAEKARAKYCVRGHLFDEANTYITPQGRRWCRKCAVIRQRARREREKAASSAEG